MALGTRRHSLLTGQDVGAITRWSVADATARLALVLSEVEEGSVAHQLDDDTFWVLIDYSVPTWSQLGGSGGVALHAPTHSDGGTDEIDAGDLGSTSAPGASYVPTSDGAGGLTWALGAAGAHGNWSFNAADLNVDTDGVIEPLESTATTGYDLDIAAGDAEAGQGGDGGNLTLNAGALDGGGTHGEVRIGEADTSKVVSGVDGGVLQWDHNGLLSVFNTTGTRRVNISDSLIQVNGVGLTVTAANGAGTSFPITITAGKNGTAGGAGADVRINGGLGNTTGAGGDVQIRAGDSPSGTDGIVRIADTNTSAVQIGAATIPTTITGGVATLVSDGSLAGTTNRTEGLAIQDAASNVATARLMTVDSDPNGQVTEVQGSLALDPATPAIYQNTDGATAWSTLATEADVLALVAPQNILELDEAAGSITYVGEAAVGTATSAAAWRIFRLDESGDPELIKLYGNGSTAFDQIWDNRAALSYS